MLQTWSEIPASIAGVRARSDGRGQSCNTENTEQSCADDCLLFREAIGQSSKTAHPHSHAQILPFNIAGTDVLWVRVSAKQLSDHSQCSERENISADLLPGVARSNRSIESAVETQTDPLPEKQDSHTVCTADERGCLICPLPHCPVIILVNLRENRG